MKDESLLEEIMIEIENLNKSIQEICPEIISTSLYPSILEESDLTSKLIEHRIELLSKSATTLLSSEKA